MRPRAAAPRHEEALIRQISRLIAELDEEIGES